MGLAKEDKELLLKDISARLSYGVKCAAVTTNNEPNTIGGYCEVFDDFYIREVGGWFNISMIKPYLRPISSMTEEEFQELRKDTNFEAREAYEVRANGENKIVILQADCDLSVKELDWLNAHHFDYRNLIEKKLALEAPEDMYNN